MMFFIKQIYCNPFTWIDTPYNWEVPTDQQRYPHPKKKHHHPTPTADLNSIDKSWYVQTAFLMRTAFFKDDQSILFRITNEDELSTNNQNSPNSMKYSSAIHN